MDTTTPCKKVTETLETKADYHHPGKKKLGGETPRPRASKEQKIKFKKVRGGGPLQRRAW